jgi:hypothetical protein
VRILFFLLPFLFLAGATASAGWNLRHFGELSPQYRRLNQEGFAPNDSVFDAFGVLNSHAEWSQGSWFAEAKPEIRAVASRGVKNAPPDPNTVSVATSRRVLNTRRTLIRDDDGEAYFDFDRLNVKYTFAQGEVFAGRKPLSLGVLRFFPVWNKLTLPLVFQPGPEWIENPDLAGASYQLGRFSYRAFASRGDEPKRDDLALFEARFFGKGFELQALGGHWWEHSAAGLTAAVDAFQSTLRLESLWISRYKDDVSQWQLGLGLERALSAKWTLIGEALYQSAGVNDFGNVTAPPNRFMVLAGKFYALPYVTYQIHPLWLVQAGFLAGLADETSYVALGGFEYSMNDNTSLNLKIKWPVGSAKGEFGEERIQAPFGRSLGMSSTALLQLQTTF